MLNFLLVWRLAQTNPQSAFLITPPLFWFILGVVLCLIEFFLAKNWATKYKFIALSIGISSLLVSFILWRAGIVLGFSWRFSMYEDFNLQIIYWMGISLASVVWVRPIFVKRKKYTIQDEIEAKTLTEIVPGEIGRVLYEGVSWQARCETSQATIAPNQIVYVLRQDGNTLVVASQNQFHS